jgi:hypothetical protein
MNVVAIPLAETIHCSARIDPFVQPLAILHRELRASATPREGIA